MTDDLIAALRAQGRPSVWWRLRDRLSIACFHLTYAIRCCIPVYGKVLRARQLAEECAEQRYGDVAWDIQHIVRSLEVAAATEILRLHLLGQVSEAEPGRRLATAGGRSSRPRRYCPGDPAGRSGPRHRSPLRSSSATAGYCWCVAEAPRAACRGSSPLGRSSLARARRRRQCARPPKRGR